MKERIGFVLLALLTITAGGCAKKVDLDAARTAIRTADAEWAKATAAKDEAGFMALVATDGHILPPNEPAVSGTNAIRQWFSGMSAMPGFSVSWKPTLVEVATSGDMGYTVGAYELTMQDPYGATINDHGKYVTVWKKQADGSWKVAVDTFNSDVPLPVPAPPEVVDPNAK